ncbi:hypothetical protein DL93DRAFT_2077462 [Clavulina sp. PMI_390]|nr:hypothetical protein DL93DRAFT_2077462 [Clavulina sp. PMI_390]
MAKTNISLLFCYLLALLYPVLASPSSSSQFSPASPIRRDEPDFATCIDFGPCEPCPNELMGNLECKATGNRRIIQCGVIGHWQACGKIVKVERWDYFEFLACNLVFAVAGVVVVFWRTRRLEELHYQNLAARIGGLLATPRRPQQRGSR